MCQGLIAERGCEPCEGLSSCASEADQEGVSSGPLEHAADPCQVEHGAIEENDSERLFRKRIIILEDFPEVLLEGLPFAGKHLVETARACSNVRKEDTACHHSRIPSHRAVACTECGDEILA